MSLRLLLVVLAGLALVATACGSASSGYRKRVDSLQAQYRPRISTLEGQLATAITKRQPATGARAATAASSTITTLQRSIAALHPPPALAARSSKLVIAYGELVHDLDLIASALRARAPERANTAIEHYNDARLDESSAIAALNAD
ncbi:MAG: hypothetical protein ABI317_07315 [Gaiellales bacterium]